MARHRLVRGSRQCTHLRHWGENSVTTWSPGATSVTSSPTASTTPAPSCPSTAGAYPDGSAPEAVYMSVWHTPQACSRTSTSRAFGASSSTSWTTSGAPNSSRTAARICIALLSLERSSAAIVRVASSRVSADVLIGVYPPAELSALHRRRRPPSHPFAEPGLTLTHLGRGAVWLALRALGLGRGSRLAMPAYHCGSEVEAAHLAGIELDFYRVDAQLRVDEDDLARAAAASDATYLISCFGFPMPDPPAGTRVIEDAAHGLFSRDADGRPLGSRGDAAV